MPLHGWADENGDWLRNTLYLCERQALLVAVPVPLFINPLHGCPHQMPCRQTKTPDAKSVRRQRK